jgi:hypothetical protein
MWNVKTKVTPLTTGSLEQLQNHPDSTCVTYQESTT